MDCVGVVASLDRCSQRSNFGSIHSQTPSVWWGCCIGVVQGLCGCGGFSRLLFPALEFRQYSLVDPSCIGLRGRAVGLYRTCIGIVWVWGLLQTTVPRARISVVFTRRPLVYRACGAGRGGLYRTCIGHIQGLCGGGGFNGFIYVTAVPSLNFSSIHQQFYLLYVACRYNGLGGGERGL